MPPSLRRFVVNLLTGSVGRLAAFILDVLAATVAHAGARLSGRRTRA